MTVNVYADEWDEERTRPGYTWRRRGLRRPLGAELLAASVYELPPGQRTWPYHWHYGNEEYLIVLEGSPSLRTPEGTRALRPGDTALFPRGEAGAHQVVNDSDRPARVLIGGTTIHPEIGVYPDSGKIVAAGGAPPTPGEDAPLELLFRLDSAVDYWEGES